jgi:hypothetical protein
VAGLSSMLDSQSVARAPPYPGSPSGTHAGRRVGSPGRERVAGPAPTALRPRSA